MTTQDTTFTKPNGYAEAMEAFFAAPMPAPRQPQQPQQPTAYRYAPSYDLITEAYQVASNRQMSQRWRTALDKAYDLLLASDGIAIEFAESGDIALAYIPSQTETGVTYAVNGKCTCKAAESGNPCAHRAAKRLLSICLDIEAQRHTRKAA